MSDTKPLCFFVSPAWRRQDLPPTSLLYPFWGVPQMPKMPFYQAVFDHYQFNTSLYTITDNPALADMVLMPYSHAVLLRSAPEFIEECAKEAKRLGKKLLVDGTGDVEHVVDIDNAVVLRYGGYKFSLRENEITIPLFAEDLLETYCNGKVSVRAKQEVPVIGFAGWTSLTAVQAIKAIIKEFPSRIRGLFNSRYRAMKKGIFFRKKILGILERSSLVKAHFITRESYSAHVHTASKDPEVLRKEFVQNLLESDYSLDIRGDANASIRLSEILSLGRIPVIIDTERNLPFRDKIDYAAFSLIIDFRESAHVAERIAEFHRGLSNEQFISMQQRARETYVQYFRVDHMTKPLIEAVRAKL